MIVIPLRPIKTLKASLNVGISYEMLPSRIRPETSVVFLTEDGREIVTLRKETVQALISLGNLKVVSLESTRGCAVASATEYDVFATPTGLKAYYQGRLVSERHG